MKKSLFILAAAMSVNAHAQYAPQAGIAGSTAISSSSPLIKTWASSCTVTRGLLDIVQPNGGYASFGASGDAMGAANGTVVSLGDSGVAVLTFAQPIGDGPGPDLAVFENGFLNPQNGEEAFLELAFVEVSSDGVAYTRFPARSLTQTAVQLSSIGGLSYTNARQIHNLAGKYTAGYGTPFDLADLAGAPGLNINAVTHVRVIDAVGSVSAHASVDDSGAVVNDPYPTAFPTGGFDLDAVAVLNSALSIEPSEDNAAQLSLFPNPTTGIFWLQTDAEDGSEVRISDATGRTVLFQPCTGSRTRIDLTNAALGLYRILYYSPNAAPWSATIIRR